MTFPTDHEDLIINTLNLSILLSPHATLLLDS